MFSGVTRRGAVMVSVLAVLTLADGWPAVAERSAASAATIPVLDRPTWTYDPGRFDSRFARAVSAAGRDVLVAGNLYEDGHAVLFDAKSGRVRLALPPGDCCQPGGYFGIAAAASPRVLAVSAPYGPGVHLFDRRTGAWLQTIPGDDPGVLFGRALAWSRDRLVVGAPWQGQTGRAFLLEGHTGQLIQTVTPPPEATNADTFGTTVAATGRTIAVGAPGEVGLGSGPGGVFVYDANGNLEATLASPLADAGDLFGAALAARAGSILVGTPRGHAYPPGDVAADLFQRRGGGWTHVRRFQVPDEPDVPSFGTAVAMDEDRVVVGAPQVQAVFVFDLRSGVLRTIVRPPPPEDPFEFETYSRFGEAVALVGRMLVVGAPGDDENVSGQVFAYRLDDHRPRP
jgi:FG-GAP repeat protein